MSGWGAVLALALWAAPPGVAQTQAEPSSNQYFTEFYRRLESIGLKSDNIRALPSKVGFHYGFLMGGAGRWGFILNNIYLPTTFQESGSERVRFDLDTTQINTLIHELAHAAADLSAANSAAPGSADREHYDAMQAIAGDLRSEAVVYRFSRMKANEVVAYTIGNDIDMLFQVVAQLVLFNALQEGGEPAHKPDAMSRQDFLAGKFVTPKPGAPCDDYLRRDLNPDRQLGRSNVYDTAGLDGTIIHWAERGFIKDSIYKHVLGLDPPETVRDLVARLNSIDNEWIREMRKKIAAARAENMPTQSLGGVGAIKLPGELGLPK